jgi:hypothetical protein
MVFSHYLLLFTFRARSDKSCHNTASQIKIIAVTTSVATKMFVNLAIIILLQGGKVKLPFLRHMPDAGH